MVQWLRIRLPMQGTRVRALVRKIPHAAEQLSPCATTTEPVLTNLRATTTEACAPRARALQREATSMGSPAPQQRAAPTHRS